MAIKNEDRRFVDFVKDDSRIVLYGKRVQGRIERELAFDRFFRRIAYVVLPLSVIVSTCSLYTTRNSLKQYESEIDHNVTKSKEYVERINAAMDKKQK